MKKRLKKKIAFNKSSKNWSWFELEALRKDILKYAKYNNDYYTKLMYPPILIPILKEVYTSLIAADIIGVQPMTKDWGDEDAPLFKFRYNLKNRRN